MSDMIEKVNENSAGAAAAEKVQAEAAAAEQVAQEKARKKAEALRADGAFIRRMAVAVVLVWSLRCAVQADLIAEVLAIWLLLADALWAGFHTGAWWQARFRKEGELHG